MSEPAPSTTTAFSASAPSPPRRLGRRVAWGFATVAAIALVGAGSLYALRATSVATDDLPSATVERGSLRVSISESGEIKADQQVVITNPVRWSVVIKELAPEGAIVKEGDLIIRMECKDLEDELLDQELRVGTAEDDYINAKTRLEVTTKQSAAKVSKATTAVVDAKNDQKKYLEGEWPQKRDDADSKISVAKGQLLLAQEKLLSKQRINADPELNRPYSDNEIREAQLNVEQLEFSLKSAETAKELLVKYEHPRTLRDKQTAVADAELDLETTRLEADTDVRLAQASADSAKVRLDKQKTRLAELQDDASKLVVKAEKPGLVVYETRRRRWDRPVTVAVDEKIDPQQQLMIIPNMKTLQVETRVYEAVREQVHADQPAWIRLDARPNIKYRGKVGKVAPLPDSQNPWLSPGVKVYPTVVTFDDGEDITGLKPGMTAKVEILLAELHDVLTVPIASIFANGEQTMVWKVTGPGQYQEVPVKVDKSSETRVQIVSGLKEGDRVLLIPPPGKEQSKKPAEPGKDADQQKPGQPKPGTAEGPDRQKPRPEGVAGPDGQTPKPPPGEKPGPAREPQAGATTRPARASGDAGGRSGGRAGP